MGFEIATEQIAAALIPNGRKALSAYTWMARIFKLIGDVMPNSAEIHLEAMSESTNNYKRLPFLMLTTITDCSHL
jgi:hypothetical protein